jgi:hemerythrin superfamily protein
MPADNVNAIELLIRDHREATTLFDEILEGEGAQRQPTFDKLANALKAHVTVEKEVFYPEIIRLMGDKVPQDVIDDQHTEETDATEMLEELIEMGVDDDEFDDKFEEFRDTVLTHATEQEEGKLFPKVREALDERQLEEIGKRMQTRKQELLRQLQRAPAR